MTATPLISVNPDELRFNFELEKQTFCDLKVLNNTQNYVAFKVKTTSPKKYFVRPNTGVVQPWDSCIIRVTLQAQREFPPDMQCKDKFLLQSTIVNPNTDVDDLPPDTFSKDSGNSIEELKLRVAYITPTSPDGSSEEDGLKNSAQKLGFRATKRRKRCRCKTNANAATGTGHAEKAKKPKRWRRSWLFLHFCCFCGSPWTFAWLSFETSILFTIFRMIDTVRNLCILTFRIVHCRSVKFYILLNEMYFPICFLPCYCHWHNTHIDMHR
ncbi:vesicle-associated protein 2-1 isoform X2 [Lotus japonicus]|uniref:vesicle-associated protein 2-1 isoform X2 n=1 Tax=Lotus japonicus TaxID=34305 RepID=UPI00258F1AD9|nr:vesicle-associated protein 2-1 isoform X2 [Lotus japonicus]